LGSWPSRKTTVSFVYAHNGNGAFFADGFDSSPATRTTRRQLMARLIDQEEQEIIRFIEADKPDRFSSN
jgi:hypothetical protein